MTLTPATHVDVSILVPAKDEVENLPEFVRLCAAALASAPFTAEVIVVNDGSRDDSAEVLRDLASRYPFLRVVTHRVQRGIADALRSASDVASGDVMVFYPADLQYLPEDIPTLVEPILSGRADVVTGTSKGASDVEIRVRLQRRQHGAHSGGAGGLDAGVGDVVRNIG